MSRSLRLGGRLGKVGGRRIERATGRAGGAGWVLWWRRMGS